MFKSKGLLSVFLSTMVAASVLLLGACEKKANITTDKQKGSYSLGQKIGGDLKKQGVELDSQTLALALQQAYDGKPSQMKAEEQQDAMNKLRDSTMSKMKETEEKNKVANQANAEKNLKEGREFLEKNKKAAGIKVSASGLQYQVLKEGKGKSPKATSTVKAHYKGTLIDGKQFDSSLDRGEPAEFNLAQVVKAWQEAVPLMKVGGKMKLFVPPELGYGDREIPGIPANSVLVFEIELISFK